MKRRGLSSLLPVSLLLGVAALGSDSPIVRHADERDGGATVIHRADVLPARNSTNSTAGGLWPLYSTTEARLNYFEVAGPSRLHFHPDADHRLYVLEGRLLLTAGTNTITAIAGDFIVIPKGVRHRYDVPGKGGRALLLTFDAPPYDPRKTVHVEGAVGTK